MFLLLGRINHGLIVDQKCSILLDNILIVGDCGTILRTNDSGTIWVKQFSGSAQNLCNISFLEDKTGVVVESRIDSTILITTTGAGITWKTSIIDGQNWIILRYVSFQDSTNIIILSAGYIQVEEFIRWGKNMDKKGFTGFFNLGFTSAPFHNPKNFSHQKDLYNFP